MHNTISIATFNIHKGFSHFNANFSLLRQRELLRNLNADLIFLQEVQDAHIRNNKRYLAAGIGGGQTEFLAEALWPSFSYGKNSLYPAGHHGNALLSKFPITHTKNTNISAHASEQRGMLHCVVEIPSWELPLHAICVHLGLFAHWRHQQLTKVAEYIEQHVPNNAPLIIAGDFNDWSSRGGHAFANRLKLKEVFEHHAGKAARSFPAWFPLLKLDRIYVRGFQVKHVETHSGMRLINVSDHAILTASLVKEVIKNGNKND